MKLVEGQIIQWLAYTLRDHAEIVSGAYKLRTTQQGCAKDAEHPDGWRDLTDEEKLRHAMNTLDAHLKWLSESVDHLPSNVTNITVKK